MFKMVDKILFGDNVTVRTEADTQAAGLAGKTGQVYGLTTPSATGVDVIGVLHRDHAINVYFADQGESFWLAEGLVEFLDHGAGTTITLDGVDKKWVRRDDGSWEEANGALERRPGS